jgi:hypothetical protein
MYTRIGLAGLVLAFCFWMISCTGSSEVHTYIHSAYLIDSSTAGIVISNYQGGNGGWLSPDEHPRNFCQKLLIYNFKTFSQQTSMVLSNDDPFSAIGVLAAGNNLIISKSKGSGSGFTRYTLNGGDPRYVSLPLLPSGCSYASIQTLTPDGKHLLLSTTRISRPYSTYGFLFDMSNSSWSSSFPLSTQTVHYLENDCTHFIWQDWIKRNDIQLKRDVLTASSSETLFDITNYTKIFESRSNSLLYRDPNGYAGYFVIDTLASPKARFVSLNVHSSVVDFDTLSGTYLAQTDTEVLIGNYKTGVAEKILYHF